MVPASFFRTANPTQAVFYFVLANIKYQLCARPWGGQGGAQDMPLLSISRAYWRQ